MGGAESIGGLQLDITERNVEPGQYVNGHIHFFLTSDLHAEALSLKFKGTEFVRWIEARNSGKTAHAETFTGRHTICIRRLPMYMFEGGFVKAGSYSFPFAIQVPDHLPGTFAKEQLGMKAFITYRLTALIENQKGVKRSKTDLNVICPYTEPIVPVQDEVAAHIKTCCCVAKGEVRLKAYFNKNAYSPREVAELYAEVDNTRSLSPVIRVTAELRRSLRLQDNAGRAKVFHACLSTAAIDVDIQPGQARTSENPIRLRLPIEAPKNELDFAASVFGTRLVCTHFVQVRVYMSGWFKCCGQKPKVDRLVTIYPQRLGRMETAPAPLGWNPILMQLVKLVILPEDQAHENAKEGIITAKEVQ